MKLFQSKIKNTKKSNKVYSKSEVMRKAWAFWRKGTFTKWSLALKEAWSFIKNETKRDIIINYLIEKKGLKVWENYDKKRIYNISISDYVNENKVNEIVNDNEYYKNVRIEVKMLAEGKLDFSINAYYDIKEECFKYTANTTTTTLLLIKEAFKTLKERAFDWYREGQILHQY